MALIRFDEPTTHPPDTFRSALALPPSTCFCCLVRRDRGLRAVAYLARRPSLMPGSGGIRMR